MTSTRHPVASARRILEETARHNGVTLNGQRTAIVITCRGLQLAILKPMGCVGRVIGRAGAVAFDPLTRPINDHVRTQLRCTFEHELRDGQNHGDCCVPGTAGLFLTGEWAYRYVWQDGRAVVLEGLKPINLLKIHPRSCLI